MRASVLLPGLVLGVLAIGASARDARACGGYFPPPQPPTVTTATVATDHRMIFSVSPTQTTLYDQVEYSGSPADFAWVLPIEGTVQVGVSSDALFAAIDAVTATTIVSPAPTVCFVPGDCSNSGSSSGSGPGGSSSGGGPPPVTILSQSTVGPYDQVQLASTDPAALTTWLTTNGYAIPTAAQSIIAAYVTEGFDFLAIRLSPGMGVQAMRPISVTTPGAGLTLPLRMVGAGTGSTVGITLWVVANGRYEPMNFQAFTISPGDLTWDWSTNKSNYETLRAQKEATSGNATWQIESATSHLVQDVEHLLFYAPSSSSGSGSDSSGGFTSSGTPIDAGSQYLAEPGDGGGEGGGETPDQVRLQDLATCFGGTTGYVTITRMRADLSQAALAKDLVLQAAADQSELPNFYQVTKQVNQPVCPTDPGCTSGSSGSGSGSGGSGGGSGAAGASPGSSGGCACSATSRDTRNDWPEMGASFLLGLSVWRMQRRRRRRA